MKMSCKCKGKGQPDKTATDNQWVGQAAVGNTSDHEEKTEFIGEKDIFYFFLSSTTNLKQDWFTAD